MTAHVECCVSVRARVMPTIALGCAMPPMTAVHELFAARTTRINGGSRDLAWLLHSAAVQRLV